MPALGLLSPSDGSGAEQEKLELLEEARPDSAALDLLSQEVAVASWPRLIRRMAVSLLPSFVQPLVTGEAARPEKPHATAYLDGMRGLASLFVVFCHYAFAAFDVDDGWGYSATSYNLLKLPIVRLLYCGPAAVAVFFAISGYAISCKPIRLLRAHKWSDFATTVSSSVFRRPFRLYLPTAASSLLVVVLLRLGAYERTRAFAYDNVFLKKVHEFHPVPLDSTWAQLQDWAWDMFRFLHVFGWDRPPARVTLDIHLWTIPIEFRCSMFVFISLVGVARLRTSIRMAFNAALFAFFFRKSRWEMMLFLGGAVVAELDQIHLAAQSSHPPQWVRGERTRGLAGQRLGRRLLSRLSMPSSWTRGFQLALPWVALYLLSQPDHSENTPGWVLLSSVIPAWWEEEKFRVWQAVGAILLVYSVSRSTSWQRFFNMPPVQYLGRISYALYLVHGPLMHTFGYRVQEAAWRLTGTEGRNYNLGFALHATVIVPAVIWAADIFWRAVDLPSVRFARWLETKCITR